MNKVAFICPLYDKENHFQYASNLVKSKRDFGIIEDLYFVFSNNSQKDKFLHLISDIPLGGVKYIVIPENLLKYRCQVTVKKFYALSELQGKYDYLATIDSESLFCKQADFSKVFHEIWSERSMLKANATLQGFFVMRKCFRTLSLAVYNDRKLRKAFGLFRYNTWFNEIPVYKCSTIPSFFEWLNHFDRDVWLNEVACFDYYLYVAYLVIIEGLSIKKIPVTSNYGAIESSFERPGEKYKAVLKEFGSHWSSDVDVKTDKTVMFYQLDKESLKDKYHKITVRSVFKYQVKILFQLIKDAVCDMNFKF